MGSIVSHGTKDATRFKITTTCEISPTVRMQWRVRTIATLLTHPLCSRSVRRGRYRCSPLPERFVLPAPTDSGLRSVRWQVTLSFARPIGLQLGAREPPSPVSIAEHGERAPSALNGREIPRLLGNLIGQNDSSRLTRRRTAPHGRPFGPDGANREVSCGRSSRLRRRAQATQPLLSGGRNGHEARRTQRA
jgi:hypothetical protein